jgi:UDP-N-acetylglucosamine 2-epimerase (non-hydrolysing)
MRLEAGGNGAGRGASGGAGPNEAREQPVPKGARSFDPRGNGRAGERSGDGNGNGNGNGDSRNCPRILSVFGTRPEAIKMAPVIEALQGESRVVSRVCVTAQHRGMLDQVLAHFAIRPHYDLDVMSDGQTASQVTSRVLERLEPVVRAERADWVLVQGDTTSAVAGALAASYAGMRVAHLEAGLRSFDRRQPFPEEINRRVLTALADLHFAPTPLSRINLLQEGVDSSRIRVTGNTGIDALYETVGRLRREGFDARPAFPRILLVTAHRQENLGGALVEICQALRTLARHFAGSVKIAFPLHPRPEVRETARALLSGIPNVDLMGPLDYLGLVRLLLQSYLVITDSGGLQEEAPHLGKPVLVLRDLTERPEGVALGSARLVGTRSERIVEETVRILRDESVHRSMARRAEPYGDGLASRRIVRILLGEPVEECLTEPASTRLHPAERGRVEPLVTS